MKMEANTKHIFAMRVTWSYVVMSTSLHACIIYMEVSPFSLGAQGLGTSGDGFYLDLSSVIAPSS